MADSLPTEPGQTGEPLDMLEGMWLLRAFEEKVLELYSQNQLAGLVHLGIGQEGVAVGVAATLRRDDYLYGSHRSHGHFLAKGADPARLLAELAGRTTGYCGGKGGSMHIVATDCGAMTATGVVAGTLPLALGTALVCQRRGQGQVVAVFFGDGAGQTGGFHESLNLATLWQLPVVLVCENNGYAEFTPLSSHTLVERLSAHGAAYSLPGEVVDGNDVRAVRAAAARAVDRARSGEGPSMVECLTYRLRGHYIGDAETYRQAGEVAEWRDKDPICRLAAGLLAEGQVSEAKLDEIAQRARQRIEEASRFALESPRPSEADLMAHVYGEARPQA